MTVLDIVTVINAYKKKENDDLIKKYEQAKLIALFTGLAFGGKEFPSFESLYPGVLEEDVSQDEELAAIQEQQKQFSMLAAAVNSSRKGK